MKQVKKSILHSPVKTLDYPSYMLYFPLWYEYSLEPVVTYDVSILHVAFT